MLHKDVNTRESQNKAFKLSYVFLNAKANISF